MIDLDWSSKVRRRYENKCSNCGGTDRLSAQMIIPSSAGGQVVESNGVLLCRSCNLVRDSLTQDPARSIKMPVNFWLSRSLYDRLQDTINRNSQFGSMSALIRYLISKYITSEDTFDDLEQYQDSGNDVKVNVWVDKDKYRTFQVYLAKRGMTVTDALKALIKMYDLEIKFRWNDGY